MNRVYYGNPLSTWIFAVGISILFYLFTKIALSLLSKRFQKLANQTPNPIDDLLIAVLKRTKEIFLFILSIYIGSQTLQLEPDITSLIGMITIIALWIQVGIWASTAIKFWFIDRHKDNHNGQEKTTLSVINTVGKVIIWSIVLILALDNIPGVEINALIASLGIGGIAVGLAVQNILEDLFSSITIALDQPFVIGDFITVGDFSGTVEHIGLKSTHIRSLTGEQLIFSNSDLLDSRIKNFKRMERRRVVLKLGVTYQTSPTTLKEIPQIVEEIVRSMENISFERVHLSGLGDFAVDFELVYWVESADYQIHMDTQQEILLRLYGSFAEKQIEFAYPTQTVFIEK